MGVSMQGTEGGMLVGWDTSVMYISAADYALTPSVF